jgi:hypothetical protein
VSIQRQRIGLSGAPSEWFNIMPAVADGLSRTLKSFSVGFVAQPSVTCNLGAVSPPKVEVVLQTKNPSLVGVCTIGDLGYVCTVDIKPTVMAYNPTTDVLYGIFDTVNFLNFKDIKTVDAVWLAVNNYFGVVEIAYSIEYSQIRVSPAEQVMISLGVIQ